MPTQTSGRRPLKSRDLAVFRSLASFLARKGVSPNAISAASTVFACIAAAALVATRWHTGWLQRGEWLLAALGIQLRLVANLLDGMVAVEGQRGGPTGDLWNEVPDRVSDIAIFAGAAFAADGCVILGLTSAAMSVFVAYVRALGASLGVGQCFLGPQAKPQRMALMTGICLFYACIPLEWRTLPPAGATFLQGLLGLVVVGCAITAWRRLRWIAAQLRAKATP